MDLTADALANCEWPDASSGRDEGSGASRLTATAGITESAPVEILALSLRTRFRSCFGGHVEACWT
jgi:6-phosphogluconate dehydrogenase (decarboxylating)